MGREHQKNDTETAQANIATLKKVVAETDTTTWSLVEHALQDDQGFDLGFTPHVMEALRQKVGTEAAYAKLISIVHQIVSSPTVTNKTSGAPLTINLNNKYDWASLNAENDVTVVCSQPDASGVINADFKL